MAKANQTQAGERTQHTPGPYFVIPGKHRQADDTVIDVWSIYNRDDEGHNVVRIKTVSKLWAAIARAEGRAQ